MNHLQDNYVLLETLCRDRDNRKNLFFSHPVETIVCHSPGEIQKSFRRMERRRQEGFFLAGFFSYELGYHLEETLSDLCPESDFPLLWFGVYEKPRIPPRENSPAAGFYLSEPTLSAKPNRYAKALGKIHRYITAGDTYQINYTTRFNFIFTGDVRAFYDTLKTNQKVSYSALITHGTNAVISLSPELFFRTDAKGNITVKPMKGTAPLHVSADWLSNDAKNRSENVMIVDLLRNDLGRICRPGTVRVRNLFAVESYETLRQMTSTVSGKLKEGLTIYDMIHSLFPCGSVTGAPKIRSMEIIRELEDAPRNIYTGAIGYFAPNGESAFNVGIRTLELKRLDSGQCRAIMGVGSGVVADSQADEEYAECRLKAQFLQAARPDFALIETMLSEDGNVSCLTDHMRRLKASADYFGMPCAKRKLTDAIRAYAALLPGRVRLRLLLKPDGGFSLEHRPGDPDPAHVKRVALSARKTRSDDPFLRHKTTHRRLYDTEYQHYRAMGYFDVLFQNEKGEVTEGAISNLFVNIRGQYFTPPVSCGLLPGIQRQRMIQKLKATERVLRLADLAKACRVVLTNAVRGATDVILDTTSATACKS